MVEMGIESMEVQGRTCMGVGMGSPCIMLTGTAAIFEGGGIQIGLVFVFHMKVLRLEKVRKSPRIVWIVCHNIIWKVSGK